MIPLMVDLKGRTVLIFGGGEVGTRKAAFFGHEADVTVLSRSFSPELETMAVRRQKVDLSGITDAGLQGLLSGAFLAVAATPDQELNERIGRICRRRGVLFNNASGEQGDVLVPSVVRGRNYTIAISTSGKSPAIPRYLRLMIEKDYAALDAMIELQAELRTGLKETEPSQERRTEILWEVLSDKEVWAALAADPIRAKQMVMERYLSA